ncbi:MAG TPA: DNA-binding response regulator [Microscillaceae bacterium]|nr:DNA-binding response regulator [Microscillaceae bacterium]
MKQVIIIDDEAPARKIIGQYLGEFPQLSIVKECKNGLEAVESIHQIKPDLVFLDVQMPGMNGFEVLKKLQHIPSVIFSTAFDQYALQAFEVNAVDYLLKPYTRDRFREAVKRVIQEESHEHRPTSSPTTRFVQQLHQENKSYPSRILVQHAHKIVAITPEDILWVEAFGDYSKIHSQKGIFLSNMGIGNLGEKLDPALFIRVHRSAIVGIQAIQMVEKDGAGSFVVSLQNQEKVRVSRSYADNIKKLMV